MLVHVLCSDSDHPVVPYLVAWQERQARQHEVVLFHESSSLQGGDVLFLVSCHEIIGAEIRMRYRHTMVLHASDLPSGRGWSPHIWDVLAGKQTLTMCLLAAADEVDSGDIWAKARGEISPDMMYDEINAVLFGLELELMDRGLELVAANASPVPQSRDGVSYHRRRTPEDSEINPEASLAEAFDTLRTADPERYPAYFKLHGHEYEIRLRKRKRDGR